VALCEHELADRVTRRIARHMAESALPRGKTFATFDFARGADDPQSPC
jgi:DNA replication protein DnaC